MKRAIGGYLLLLAAAGTLATLYDPRPRGVDSWPPSGVAAELPRAGDLPPPLVEPLAPGGAWLAAEAPEVQPPQPALPADSPADPVPPPPPAPPIEEPPPAPPLATPAAPPDSPPPAGEPPADELPADAEWDGMLPVAGSMSGTCDLCGACQCRLVERVIWTPMDITEVRMESHIVSETKEQEETYTVFRRVPVTREFKRKECYLVDEVRTKTIFETECYRVNNPVVTTYTAQVPVTEIREEMCKKTICTEDGPVCVEVPVPRAVTVLEPQECSEVSEQPGVAFGTKTREISYTVKVPKYREVVCSKQTVYELVPVEKKRTVQVCVPKVIELPNEVTVCKLVAQKIYCCPACAKKHAAERCQLSERRDAEHRRHGEKEGPFAKLHEAWSDHLEKHEGPLAKLHKHRHGS